MSVRGCAPEFDGGLESTEAVSNVPTSTPRPTLILPRCKKDKGDRELTLEEEVLPEPQWHWVRTASAVIFASEQWDLVLGVAILLNMMLVVLETDLEASGGLTPQWVKIVNNVLSGLYFVELILRINVYRVRFFCHAASWLDLSIVGSDVLFILIDDVLDMSSSLPSMSTLRVFKLTRLTRAVRVLVVFPQLRLMVKGLKGAIMAVFWGCTLLAATLCVWGILFVQLVHGPNTAVAAAGLYEGCERCPRAFSTVAQASLTFVQTIVAGDSWGTVCVPVIEEAPWTFPLFMGVLVSVGLVIMNLILAVIVDSAQEARKGSDHELAAIKEKEFEVAKGLLLRQCERLDTDQSGSLNLQELIEGFDSNEAFRDALGVMDIHREDMDMVFSILDEDNSGDVNYDEFVSEIYRMKSHDTHTLLIFIKFYVEDLRSKVQDSMKVMTETVHNKLDQHAQHVNMHFKAGLASQDTEAAPEVYPSTAKALHDPQPSPSTCKADLACVKAAAVELPTEAKYVALVTCTPGSTAWKDPELLSETSRHAHAILLDSFEAFKQVFEEAVTELHWDQGSRIQPTQSSQERSFEQESPLPQIAADPTPEPEVTAELCGAEVAASTQQAHFGAAVRQLGLELLWQGSSPTIGSVQPGSEGGAQGLLPGDVVASCNGRPTDGRLRDDILQTLRERPLTLGVIRRAL